MGAMGSGGRKHLGVAYNLRLPEALKEKVAESAKKLNRSINADIVARIEQSFSEGTQNESTVELQTRISYLEGVIQGYDSAIKKLAVDYLKSQGENTPKTPKPNDAL